MIPPLTSVASDTTLTHHVDVAVVGGGIAGASAAWELARAGLRVALLEKGSVGAEQSCRNWGWCRQQNRDERELPLAILALQIWETLSEDLGGETGFRRSGLIYASNDDNELNQWQLWGQMARKYGVDTRMITADQIAAMIPAAGPRWKGGVWSPTDGRAEPALVTPLMAEAARRHGATIHQTCAVREIEFSAGRVSGVVTERGRIGCACALIAGGAWSGMLLRHHGLKFLQASIQSTSFATSPLPEVTAGGFSAQDITIRRRLDGGYTVGTSGFGRLHLSPRGVMQIRPFWKTFQKRRAKLSYTLGSSFFNGPDSMHHWSGDSRSPFERSRVLDPTPEPRLLRRGLSDLTSTFPTLQGATIAHSWGGIVDCTPDAIPVIGPVTSRPGLYISAGHSGHGFGIGPAAGRLVAELVQGLTPSVDPKPFRYERMIDGTDLGEMGMM